MVRLHLFPPLGILIVLYIYLGKILYSLPIGYDSPYSGCMVYMRKGGKGGKTIHSTSRASSICTILVTFSSLVPFSYQSFKSLPSSPRTSTLTSPPLPPTTITKLSSTPTSHMQTPLRPLANRTTSRTRLPSILVC